MGTMIVHTGLTAIMELPTRVRLRDEALLAVMCLGLCVLGWPRAEVQARGSATMS